MPLMHSVHFKFKAHATEADRKNVFDLAQTLVADCGGEEAGILYFDFGENADQRKGVEFVEHIVFVNDEALQEFRRHPRHVAFAEAMSAIADWTVGDRPCPYL